MAFRYFPACLVLLVGLAATTTAEAQCASNHCSTMQCNCNWLHQGYAHLQGAYHDCCRDFQRNNCWPEPFLAPDRLAVRAPFVIMVNNGWRRQNLFTDRHFMGGTATLNDSGERKVRWTMTQAPLHHRTLYVRRAETPEQTAERIEAVRELATYYADSGQVPTVLETTIDDAGWPATRVDAIGRRLNETVPEPRLPDAAGSGAAAK